MVNKRVRLSALEIEAILAVAGEVDAPAACESFACEGKAPDRMLDAFESGMNKLRVMLDRLSNS